MATPSARRGLHAQVVDLLGLRIVSGELEPGDTIDYETYLVECDVSRTVLREAIKVLSAKGLLDARPRLGTYVTERARWQLLDGDVMAWRSGDEPDPALVRDLEEVRMIFEPAAARLAAARRTEPQLAAIGTAFERMRLDSRGQVAQVVDADIGLHLAILRAAGNELLEQFEVVLQPALVSRHAMALSHESGGDYVRLHEDVYLAIAAGDENRAEEAMRLLIVDASHHSASLLGSGRGARSRSPLAH